MKIGVIISCYPVSTETFIAREFQKIEALGFELELLSLKNPKENPGNFYKPCSVNMLPFFPTREMLKSNFSFCLKYFKKISVFILFLIRKNIFKPFNILKFLSVMPKTIHYYYILKSKGVSHIHSHWTTLPALCAFFLSEVTGITYSITAHAWDIYVDQTMLKDKLEKSVFVVTCTGHNADYLKGLVNRKSEKRMILNYHGIDLKKYIPKTEYHNDYLIVTAGRLIEKKGLKYLLMALEELNRSGRKFRLSITGEGPEKAKLEKLAQKLGISEKVVFTGFLPHEKLVDIMREAAVFILPCVRGSDGSIDGIPNVLAEAMAVGTPVISTNISGIPELVSNGKEGFLVPEKDVSGLTKALQDVLGSGKMRRIMGMNARKKAENMFDINKNVSELAGIFKRYLSR